jgi:hypothetical protein
LIVEKFVCGAFSNTHDTQKLVDAVNRNAEAIEQSKQEPLPIPLPVLAELHIPEAHKTEQGRQHDQNLKLQRWLTVGTWLAFAAAAIYAFVAYRQKQTMDDTYDEIHQQTSLLRDQLKGSEAAFLEVYPAIGTKVGDFDTAFNVIKVVIRNSGHAIAINVAFHMTVTQTTIDGKTLGKPLIYEISEPVLGFKSGDSDLAKRYVFEDSEQAEKILESAGRLERSVRVQWYYSYGNGFGDVIKSNLSCISFLSTDWVPCENFPALLHDLRNRTGTIH